MIGIAIALAAAALVCLVGAGIYHATDSHSSPPIVEHQ